MKKIGCCLLVFLVGIQFASAQFETVPTELNDLSRFIRDQKVANKIYTGKKETNVKGSPYLSDTFQKGAIVMQDSTKYKDIPLRFHIYLDEMEFKDEIDQIWAINNPEVIGFIELEKKKIVYRSYVYNRIYRQGFFIALAEGAMNLLQKPQMIVTEAKEAAPYKDPEPAKFVSRPALHFFQLNNKGATPILNKKDLLAGFPDKHKELEAFIKRHKVKPNKPETLIKLVRYYNKITDALN